MDVQINVWGVLLATVLSMVVGFVWYARPVFGNVWMDLAKVKMEKDKDKMQKAMMSALLVALVGSLLTAYILAHLIFLSHHFFNNSFLSDSLTTAFWVWLGLSLTRFAVHDAFEGRPMKLTLLNVGNELATLLAMGLAIGLVGL
jgi:cation transport ATPase